METSHYFADPRERAKALLVKEYKELVTEKVETELAGRPFARDARLREVAAGLADVSAVERTVECGMPNCETIIDMDADSYFTFPVVFVTSFIDGDAVGTTHFDGTSSIFFEKLVCVPCWEQFESEVTQRPERGPARRRGR